MKVTLLNNPTLEFVDNAIGQCYAKGPFLQTDPDRAIERIDRICNKLKHASMLRFVPYIFEIEASTKTLLAITRHQTMDFAVQSTRYTTKAMLKDEEPFVFTTGSRITDIEISDEQWERSKKYLYHTGNDEIDTFNIRQLEKVRQCCIANYSNDDIAMMLPQAWIYKFQVQANAQSLQNFFNLRLPGTHAHKDIQDVAQAMLDEIPESHKFLFIKDN